LAEAIGRLDAPVRTSEIRRRNPSLEYAACRFHGSWRAALEAAGLTYPDPPHRSPWTPERVIAAIRDRHASNRPITSKGAEAEAGACVKAGRKLFGDWPAAVAAAGITYPGRCLRRWAREEILEALRRMEREQGFAGAWRLERFRLEGYERIRSAIRREFGSLRRAKELAGVRTWPLWTPQRVREEILSRRDRGESLISTVVQEGNPRLMAGAHRAYGSWSAALAACGVAPVPPQADPWPHEKIRQALKDEGSRRGGVRWSELRTKYHGLRQAAILKFGSWSAALAAAGLREPPRIRMSRWTRERVIKAIQEGAEEGQDVSRASLLARRGTGIVQAAARHFGSWNAALEAAGVPPPPPRPPAAPRRPAPEPWTPEKVLGRIQEESRRDGDMRCCLVEARGGRALVKAARRHFGRWLEALRAAGIPAPPPKCKFTREDVIEKIRTDAREQRDMRVSAAGTRHGSSFPRAAKKYFGGWRGALEAAGVPRPEYFRGRWTREEVIQTIQEEWRERQDVRSISVGLRHGAGIYGAAVRHFGGWRGAQRAASVPVTPFGRCEKWTAARIVEIIREEWRSRHRCSVKQLSRRAPGIFIAARRNYGSWRGALEAAGVPVLPQVQVRRGSGFVRAIEKAGLRTRGSPDLAEGQEVRLPCRSCGAMALPFVVGPGVQDLRCPRCGGTVRAEARLENGRWRIRSG
jgi:hypothetical protein